MPFRSSGSGGCQVTSSDVEERVVTLTSVGGPDGATNDELEKIKLLKKKCVVK